MTSDVASSYTQVRYSTKVAAYNDYLYGNIGITSERVMLKDFMSAWLDNVTALNVRPTTMQTYQSVINCESCRIWAT